MRKKKSKKNKFVNVFAIALFRQSRVKDSRINKTTYFWVSFLTLRDCTCQALQTVLEKVTQKKKQTQEVSKSHNFLQLTNRDQSLGWVASNPHNIISISKRNHCDLFVLIVSIQSAMMNRQTTSIQFLGSWCSWKWKHEVDGAVILEYSPAVPRWLVRISFGQRPFRRGVKMFEHVLTLL